MDYLHIKNLLAVFQNRKLFPSLLSKSFPKRETSPAEKALLIGQEVRFRPSFLSVLFPYKMQDKSGMTLSVSQLYTFGILKSHLWHPQKPSLTSSKAINRKTKRHQ